MIDVIVAQHDRGRQITAFIQDKCNGGKIGTGDADPVARAMEGFARMYEAHTAFEDTILFQAWRQSMSGEQLKEMSEKFEDIEHEEFKGDGFDIAQSTITDIEKRLGLDNLQNFTAQPPGPA